MRNAKNILNNRAIELKEDGKGLHARPIWTFSGPVYLFFFLPLVQIVQPLKQSSGNLITYPAKRRQLLLFGSFGSGRVIEGPVEPLAHTWKHLGTVPFRPRTDEDHILHCHQSEIFFGTLGPLPGNVNSDLLHDRLDHRMDSVGIQTSTVDVESVARVLSQDALCHLAAGRVPSAENENVLRESMNVAFPIR